MKIIITLFVLLLTAMAYGATPSQTATARVNWTDNSNNEDGFTVERAASPTATFTALGNVAANVVTYSDVIVGDPGGTQFCYRVRAYNSAGVSAYSNIACGVTPVITVPPNAPTGLSINVNVNININQ